MRLLFLAADFAPVGVAGAIRPTRLAKHFSRLRHEVRVIAASSDDDTFRSLLQGLEKVRVRRLPIPKVPLVNDRGVAFALALIPRMRRLVRTDPPDAVFLSVPAFFPMLVALWVRWRYGIPFILDYRDLWAGDPYPPKTLKALLFRTLARLVEPPVLRASDLTVFVSEAMRKEQTRIYPLLGTRPTAVVSTGYDGDDVAHATSETSADAPDPALGASICHLGTLDETMNVEDLCRLLGRPAVARLLAARGLRFRFVGARNAPMERAAARWNVSRFMDFRPRVSPTEAIRYMRAARGLLILGSDSAQRLNRKVFEYVMHGEKILYLGNTGSPTASVLRAVGCPYLAPSDDLEAAEHVLLSYLTEIDDGARLAREKVRIYEKSALAREYLEIIARNLARCVICRRGIAKSSRVGSLVLYRCPSCGLVQRRESDWLLSLEEAERIHYVDGGAGGDEYTSYRSEAWMAFDRARAAFLAWKLRITSFLDVGSGWGRSLAAFQRVGVRSLGLEPNAAAADWSRRQLGVEVVCASIEDHRPLERFDLVQMIQVLEHIAAPIEAVRNAYAALAPGGTLVIETGNYGALLRVLRGSRWTFYKMDHRAYYTRRAARALLRRAGVHPSRVTIRTGPAFAWDLYRSRESRAAKDVLLGRRKRAPAILRHLAGRILSTTMTIYVRG